MPKFTELARQACEQVIKRKEKRFRQYVAMIENDPEFEEFLDELTALRNGRKPTNRKPRPVREPIRHKYSAGLEAAIISVRPELPKRVDADEVQKLLEDRFRFNSKDHKKAIRDALYRMKESGRLKMIEKGAFEFVA